MSKLTLSFKGRVLKIFPVQQGSMVIGSDPSSNIHIDSLAVEPKHARIETHGQDSILFDLDSEGGTFIQQDPISEHKLKDGDLIRVGKHTLTYNYEEVPELDANESSTSISVKPQAEASTPEPEPPQAPAGQDEHRQGWVQILNGQNLGKTLSLNRSMTNLGKPGVATAVITKRNEGYYISHLEGKVAPLVQDEPIGEHSVKLNDGDYIQIGNVKLQFYLE